MDMPKILYLTPDRNNPHYSKIASSLNGNIIVASDLTRARELLEEGSFDLGLFQLETSTEAFLQRAIEEVMQGGKDIEWIALVSPTSIENEDICGLIAEHFYDYHTLPLDLNRLQITLGHAHGMASIKKRTLRQQNSRDFSKYGMVAGCQIMEPVFQCIAKIAHTDMLVLITGESGTGKELAALAIHKNSARSKGPCIPINCGALPSTLIQSELFGYEKGAFTGANQRKIGLIERASGGTIFLDEIGDLSLELQVILLRFLEHKSIIRVGGHEEIPVDVRTISATHIDLEEAVRQGRFREDLYYRLNVLRLKLPPLREREDDIELLAQHFFESLKKQGVGKPNVRGFSRKALRAIRGYNWPGNIRELKNRVESAMVMCDNLLIMCGDLGLDQHQERPYLLKLREAKDSAEKEAVEHALRQRSYCISETALALGVSHVTLYRLIKKYGVQIQRY